MSNLRDVAKKADVSLATVARVLSNDESFKVTPETKEKIFSAAKDLNYIYKSKKTKKKPWRVGFILALTAEKYSDPYFTSILSAAEAEAEKLDIQPIIARNYNELLKPEILKEFLDFELDGVIIMERLPADMMQQLQSKIPHIIGIDPIQSNLNIITFDAYRATTIALEHLIQKGNRRIAYIGGAGINEVFDDTLRMAAYRETLRRNDLTFDEAIVRNCDWDLNTCGKQTDEILALENRPDAIFAGSDTLGSVILGRIFASGLRCPDDISVIGFNNIPTSEHTTPPLSTIEVPTKTIGKLAIKRLHELLTNTDTEIYTISLPVTLIERESTGGKSK
ncbi:LacI family transcriptional regulator [Breznakia blatticola]|uniref:LacI family transcriptional regulator n=1 Tax=Breznakia blatticola TaxID=1754012 RepID=A0A4R7ZCT4_9FIRM|nr:LacI family DNA-binding transcriptional regulator [Breznakia blatticola]TDW13211.1 LacI family transcriptional regulator [Breznakia blatticola]